MAKTIDLELTRAEVEVLELEARLRVVPMNDTQLSDALKTALLAKKERLDKLRTLHAASSRPTVSRKASRRGSLPQRTRTYRRGWWQPSRRPAASASCWSPNGNRCARI